MRNRFRELSAHKFVTYFLRLFQFFGHVSRQDDFVETVRELVVQDVRVTHDLLAEGLNRASSLCITSVRDVLVHLQRPEELRSLRVRKSSGGIVVLCWVRCQRQVCWRVVVVAAAAAAAASKGQSLAVPVECWTVTIF